MRESFFFFILMEPNVRHCHWIIERSIHLKYHLKSQKNMSLLVDAFVWPAQDLYDTCPIATSVSQVVCRMFWVVFLDGYPENRRKSLEHRAISKPIEHTHQLRYFVDNWRTIDGKLIRPDGFTDCFFENYHRCFRFPRNSYTYIDAIVVKHNRCFAFEKTPKQEKLFTFSHHTFLLSKRRTLPNNKR